MGNFYLNPLWPLFPGRYVCPRKMRAVSQLKAFHQNWLWAPLRDWDVEEAKNQPARVAVDIKRWYKSNLGAIKIYLHTLPPYQTCDLSQGYISSENLDEPHVNNSFFFFMYFCLSQDLTHNSMHFCSSICLVIGSTSIPLLKICSFLTRWMPPLPYLGMRISPSSLWDPLKLCISSCIKISKLLYFIVLRSLSNPCLVFIFYSLSFFSSVLCFWISSNQPCNFIWIVNEKTMSLPVLMCL